MIAKLATAAGSLMLGYLILTKALVAYLAPSNPDAALFLSPSDPEALLTKVDHALIIQMRNSGKQPSNSEGQSATATTNTNIQQVEPSQEAHGARAKAIGLDPDLSAEDVKALREMTTRALAADPTSVRALRILGQLAYIDGDDKKTDQFYAAATQRSLREGPAVLMLWGRNLEQKNWPQVIHYADILMRTRPETYNTATIVLAQVAEEPSGTGFDLLVKALLINPPWRTPFLDSMPSGITNAETPLKLFLALKDAGSPVTPQQTSNYLNFLVSRRLYEPAYEAWLRLLPSEHLAVAGNIFDGSFRLPRSGDPFDWNIEETSSAAAVLVPLPDEPTNRALKLELGPGRVVLGKITQRLNLRPGDFIFTGQLRGELAGRRGLKWQIMCADQTNDLLGETPQFLGKSPKWVPFKVAVKVPPSCRSQVIKLTHDSRYSADQFAAGTVWYTDLTITKSAADNVAQ